MTNNITKVYLLNVPLENDYKNTLYFSSEADQQSYFSGRKVKTYTNFTYQRKDNFIRVPDIYDSLLNCNYVMYQNAAYNNKWFYAFITDMKYIDDGRTDVYIETDCFQTWYFEMAVKPSFIEREHVSDDTIGANTIPEGLEMGDFVANSHRRDTKLDNLQIILGVTEKPESFDPYSGGLNGNIYSGITYLNYPVKDYADVNALVTAYSKGHAEAIKCMFMAPEFLTEGTDIAENVVGNSTEPKEYNITYAKDYYMNGEKDNIKNNKLFTFPFNYLLVSNNNGSAAVYKYEYFSGDEIQFKVQGVLTPGCSIRMVPQNYKGTTALDEEGINLGKYPICNWASDVYTNWLTQNSVNIGISLVTGVAQVAGGVAATVATAGTGAVLGGGAIVGGVSTIANTLGEIHKQSFTPPQAEGNLNCGDVITSSGKNAFHFYNMSMKKEYIKIIDEFFTMFGYKVNRVKTPNKNHRARFWYTKTIDVNIDGPIPNKDMQVIKDAYNKGITFWRNAADINNYTLTNNIV